ncbi:hypothetical protein ACFWGN_18010 [Oerskovia sp. NPDC060338]|uniref:hypothetical protein n=1 Tax=Oerskovia sp. NPDC060338 TaxID=3347100 RepID=UPI00365D9CE9
MTKPLHAFFVTPIGAEGSETRERSDKVLAHILTPALVPTVVSSIERADHSPNPGEITATMIASILESDLIVADLTGSNPNVYYEVALAHAFGKPVVHIRLATEDRLPFDIKDVRVFDYSFDVADARKCAESVEAAASLALTDPKSVQTPVDRGRVAAQSADSENLGDRVNAEIMARLDSIDSRLVAMRHTSTDFELADLSGTEAKLIRLVRDIASLESSEPVEDNPALAEQQLLLSKALRAKVPEYAGNAIEQALSQLRHPSFGRRRAERTADALDLLKAT